MSKITKEIFIDGKFDVIVEKKFETRFNYLGSNPELDKVYVTLMWENHKITAIGMCGYEYERLKDTETFKDLWFWAKEDAQKYYDMTTEQLLREVNSNSEDLLNGKISNKTHELFNIDRSTWCRNSCKFKNKLGYTIVGENLRYYDDDKRFKQQFIVEHIEDNEEE